MTAECNGTINFAIAFSGAGQLYLGLPGNEAIPAKQGVILVPSGGMIPAVRTVIQWASSHPLGGNSNPPEYSAPAASIRVSPQRAVSIAFCSPPPAGTLISFPGEGVPDNAV